MSSVAERSQPHPNADKVQPFYVFAVNYSSFFFFWDFVRGPHTGNRELFLRYSPPYVSKPVYTLPPCVAVMAQGFAILQCAFPALRTVDLLV